MGTKRVKIREIDPEKPSTRSDQDITSQAKKIFGDKGIDIVRATDTIKVTNAKNCEVAKDADAAEDGATKDDKTVEKDATKDDEAVEKDATKDDEAVEKDATKGAQSVENNATQDPQAVENDDDTKDTISTDAGHAPLPADAPPAHDDGWDCAWLEDHQRHLYWNKFTGERTWNNPRVPDSAYGEYGYGAGAHAYHAYPVATSSGAYNAFQTGTNAPEQSTYPAHSSAHGASPYVSGPPGLPPGTWHYDSANPVHGHADNGATNNDPVYNPKIHGNWDPNADYAVAARKRQEAAEQATAQPTAFPFGAPGSDGYAAAATFNHRTGQFQSSDVTADRHSDANKALRQQNAYFDANASANSHDGRSLKEERRNQKLSKAQLQQYRQKKADKKLQKQRDWLLRD